MHAQDSIDLAERSSAHSDLETFQTSSHRENHIETIFSYELLKLPAPPKPKYSWVKRLIELVHLPKVLSLAQDSGYGTSRRTDYASEVEDEEELCWRPSITLAKEFRKISVYSDSRVILTSPVKTKFGRVLFKKRLCRRQKLALQGEILQFLRKNSWCRRPVRL